MWQAVKHRLAHWFGWNGCVVVDWHDDKGQHHIGAMCATCGVVHPDTVWTPAPPRARGRET